MRKKSLFAAVCAAMLICAFATGASADNSMRLLVNGQEAEWDAPPQIIDGRAMAPVRWLAEALGAEVEWDEESNAIIINKPCKPSLVSFNSEADAKLYSFQETNGMYDGFILEVKDNRQYFDWESVDNPSFSPRILFNDIDQDGEKELIVILVTGTGTGVHTENIHVLDHDALTEIDVEAPAKIVEENIVSKIETDEDQVAIKINIDGEETIIYQEKDYAAIWFDNVIFSNINRYEVVDDKLTVRLPAQVSPAGFIGDIAVTYQFENGKFRADTIKYFNEGSLGGPATASETDKSNYSPEYIQALRGEYFEFGIENRLDYVPLFEEGQAPSDSTEYLFYAFAINLNNWGDDKGTMTRDYVEHVIRTHFGVETITHAPLRKGWDYDGEKYTAIPGSIAEEPIYVLQDYKTFVQNGRTIYEITLDQCSYGNELLSEEDYLNIKAGIISGDLSGLTVTQTECFRYYLDEVTGEVVFLSHTLVPEPCNGIE